MARLGLSLGELVEAASSAFSSIGKMPAGGAESAWLEVNPFFGRLMKSVSDRWLPTLAERLPCTLRAPSEPGCSHLAIGRCMACKEPVCPYHGCVDHGGNVICYACVGIAAHVRKNAPPPADTREAIKAKKREAAYRELGLDPGASLAEVKKAHRKLAKLHHPDRGGDIGRSKRINEALHTLKAELEPNRSAA